MKKRSLSLILALLFSACPLTACSDTTAPSEEKTDNSSTQTTEAVTADTSDAAETEETVEEVSFVSDTLETKDFEGAEYKIAGPSNRTTTAITSSELTGEVINDAQYNSRIVVEERFNTKISYTDIANGDDSMTTAIKNIVNAGEDEYGITFGCDSQQISLSLSGYYQNLKAMPAFDFNMPWWTDSTQQISIGDKSYVASSYLSYYCLYYIRMFVINKGMAKDLGVDVPYQKVYEGNWYLDDLYDIASKGTLDIDGDSAMTAKDRYGLTYDALYTLQNSMDVTVYDKDADNMPVMAFDVEKADEYLTKMTDMLTNYGYKSTNYGADMFVNEQSLMCYCNLREVCNIIRDSEIEYGFLPAPKINESQEDYMTVATDVYWGAPASVLGKSELISTITEALQCQNFNNVRPAFFETTLKGKLADSPDDINMLDLAASKLSIDFTYAYQSSLGVSTLDDLINDGVKPGNVASTYQKVTKMATKSLEKLLAKYTELP